MGDGGVPLNKQICDIFTFQILFIHPSVVGSLGLTLASATLDVDSDGGKWGLGMDEEPLCYRPSSRSSLGIPV